MTNTTIDVAALEKRLTISAEVYRLRAQSQKRDRAAVSAATADLLRDALAAIQQLRGERATEAATDES